MNSFLARLLEPKTNAPEITYILSQLLNVDISKSTIKTELEEHPDYPSLLSISDLLSKYGVENLSMKLDLINVIDVPVPFITQIKDRKRVTDFFTVVKQITVDHIYFFDPETYRWESADSEDFLKRCSGIVLLTEVTEGSGEKDYLKNSNIEKRQATIQSFMTFWLPAIICIAGITALLQTGKSAVFPVIFSILTLIGAIVGVLLLFYELDQYNPLLQQICSSSGKKTNCGAILQSKASKIAGISWSTIGLSYFIGNLLLLLFEGITNTTSLFIVAVLNIVAVPYVFYSIYYQWRIAKQWCVLCLAVQSVLVLQFVIIFTNNWYKMLPLNEITFQILIQIVAAFSIPFIIISILFPALRKAKEGNRINTDFQRLKHNPQVFEALLTKEKEVTHNPEGLGITLGNPNASYKVIKVCNPYCGPCAKAHVHIEELLNNNHDVQVQIIFSVSNDDSDTRNKPAKHLLALDQYRDEEGTKKALDDWYLSDSKDYETFAAKYPMNGELKMQGQKVLAMEEWCKNTDVNFTPTFFISIPTLAGEAKFHQLPSMYTISEMKYFLPVNLE